MMDKAILTCALTGVLTNPSQHPVPVTPEQMAQEARDAFNAGASVMHVHLRQQEEGKGHLPSWDPEVAAAVVSAIREACPGVIINLTTGVVGKDVSGPLACIRRIKPEIAACNAGSLNYLKIRDDGQWAWPPMVFDNPVTKVQQFLDVMLECGVHPEFECFDVGIVRSVARAGSSRIQPGDGRGVRHALRCRFAGIVTALDGSRQRLADDPDWPCRNLARASENSRSGGHASYRSGGHVLSAGWGARQRQWCINFRIGKLRTACWSTGGKPGRSARPAGFAFLARGNRLSGSC